MPNAHDISQMNLSRFSVFNAASEHLCPVRLDT